ncbi:MAG: FtsW/RodA/SpoVE family cell cycle protein [Propionibacteriaceae bacterium]|nr:FtsW/RodA/SpoVE family cell cycle protein [Propionibacteriaceae bacterium]
MTSVAAAAPPKVPTRRWVELGLLVPALAVGISGYVLTNLNRTGALPPRWWLVPALCALLVLAAHVVVRVRTPYADPVILPVVVTLCGLGLAMLNRLDMAIGGTDVARTQLVWMVIGVAAFAAVIIWLRDYRVLQRYPYLLFIVGMILLLMPLMPVIGTNINGSRIWIRIAGYSFQPAEVAKIVLTLAFASYLADRSDVLASAGKKLGALTLPRLRDIVPVFVMWAAGVVVLVFQNDLGTALLFFGLFVVMMYVATDRISWVVGGLFAFAGAAAVIYRFAGHVQVRVDSWLHPFSDMSQNYQIIEGQFGMAWGGLFGRGWGLGSPSRVPLANTDFISAALGEEIGLVGLVGIIVLYALIVSRGLKTALLVRDSFGKLLTAGFSFVFVLQVTAIIGGVTRLLPLTGLTTPFLSRGGSSLVANWAIAAILIVVSHQARRPVVEFEPFVDLDVEQTAVIDLSSLEDGPVGPRVSASEDDTTQHLKVGDK